MKKNERMKKNWKKLREHEKNEKKRKMNYMKK